MILLALDSATPSSVAGVRLADGRVVEARDDPQPESRGEHAARLLPLAERALREAGVGWEDLARIAVGVGPGGFTGLRIGIATARALAQGLGLPLVPVSSLRALAEGAAGEPRGGAAGEPAATVLAVVDARRGEVFAAAWTAGREVLAPAALAPEALAERLAGLERAPAGGRGRGDTLQAGDLDGRSGGSAGRLARPPHRGRGALPARRGGGAGRPGPVAARLPAGARRQATPAMTAPPAAAIDVRRLTYADLPQVVAIERRAFPTPWSLAMFVLELSKPSGICLAAFVEGALTGYLVCSRYDTVWHIMNVAVDPGRRRMGIATTLLMRLFERVDDPDAHYTLEVRRSNHGAMELYDRYGFRAAGVRRRYYQDNGEDAVVMWRTPATLRGTLDDVPNASPA